MSARICTECVRGVGNNKQLVSHYQALIHFVQIMVSLLVFLNVLDGKNSII